MGRDSPSHAGCRLGLRSFRQRPFHTDDAPSTSRQRQRAGPTAGPPASLPQERIEEVVPGELFLTPVVGLPAAPFVGRRKFLVGRSNSMRWGFLFDAMGGGLRGPTIDMFTNASKTCFRVLLSLHTQSVWSRKLN